MDLNEVNLNSWNKVAEMYESYFMDLDIYNSSYQSFCNLFKETKPRILDIGCGPGNITKQLLKLMPSADLMGIDMAENMIVLAKKNVPNAYFEVMDCRNLDHYHGEFEGVVAGFCIPYLNADETAKLFADVYDVLTEDGIFYVSFVAGEPSNLGFFKGSKGGQKYFNFFSVLIARKLS